MNKIIDNTVDGLHVYEYDIAYYYNADCEKQYVFATSEGFKTMTFDYSLGEILVKGEHVANEKFYLSMFSLYKRLIAAGILTPKSMVEYSSDSQSWGMVRDLLKRSFQTFEAIYQSCQFKMENCEGSFVFTNQRGETIYSDPLYEFFTALFEELSSAILPRELDWFLIKRLYAVKERK